MKYTQYKQYLPLARWLVEQNMPTRFDRQIQTENGRQRAAVTVWRRHSTLPRLNDMVAATTDADSPTKAVEMAFELIVSYPEMLDENVEVESEKVSA